MEEIAEGIFKSLGSIVRWLLWNLLFEIILFNLGRGILLLVTIGNYPRGEKLERDETYISLAGVGVVVIVWVSIALYNNW